MHQKYNTYKWVNKKQVNKIYKWIIKWINEEEVSEWMNKWMHEWLKKLKYSKIINQRTHKSKPLKQINEYWRKLLIFWKKVIKINK